MIRFELIKRISEKFEVEETEAGVFVDGIFESMVNVFKKGNRINIPEFGKFNITNKTVEGVRQRYVVFSPAKNFADSINKNFSDLEPIAVNAYNVKKNEVLKVKEILLKDNEEEYLYFEFTTDEEDEKKKEIIETDLLKAEEPPAENLIKDEILPQEDTALPTDIHEQAKETVIVSSEITDTNVESPNKDEILPQEDTALPTDIQEQAKETVIESSENTDTNIFTEINPIVEEEVIPDVKKEQSIFDEEIDENAINQQTVFADIPDDTKLQEQILLSKLSENQEEQILKNEKVIDEVEKITPLSVRVNLKDDMNVDNIKEEIFDILVRREEIIRELNELNKDAEIKQEEPARDNKTEEITETPKVEEVPKIKDDSDDIFADLEKRIKDLDELSQKKEEIKKVDLSAPKSQEMQIFGKLIDDKHEENKKAEEGIIIPRIIIHDPEPKEIIEEPKSLSDALEDIKAGGIIEFMDDYNDENGANSYDDIFRKSDRQFVPQFSVESEKKNTQGRFFKIFLYLFFIFLLTAFSFYIYKTMFTNSSSNQVSDTLGLSKIDSVRVLLKKVEDSIARKDTTTLKADSKSDETESIEIKNLLGVVYRELKGKIYIQNKVFDDLNAAEEMELKLKSNNLNCIVEGATKIDNGLEYRVLVGPFKNMKDAMDYYEKNKVILNFIQIMNPNKPNLLVF